MQGAAPIADRSVARDVLVAGVVVAGCAMMMIASNLLWLLEYDSHLFMDETGSVIEPPPVRVLDIIRDSHGVRFLLLTPLLALTSALIRMRRVGVLLWFPMQAACGAVVAFMVTASYVLPFIWTHGAPVSELFVAVPLGHLVSKAASYMIVAALVDGVLSYHDLRAQERHEALLQSELADWKLRLLAMQLNPHFLFNTLNAIATLIPLDQERAQSAIAQLSHLLRRSLADLDRNQITVAEEMQNLEAYLSIERLRFGAGLTVTTEVSPEVRGALVPPMLLQPIVENSIIHGEARERESNSIAVTVRRVGQQLEVQVADDGAGLGTGEVSFGTGLGNTTSRLEVLYGDDASFSIDNRPESGVVVLIRIPYAEAPAHAQH